MTRNDFTVGFKPSYLRLVNGAYGLEGSSDERVARVANWIRANYSGKRPAFPTDDVAHTSLDSLEHMMLTIGPSIQPGDLDAALAVVQ